MPAVASPIRQVISEGVIALAACAGAYFLLVDPVQCRVDDLRAQAAQSSAASAGETLPAAQAAAELARVTGALATMEARSSPVNDEAGLFAALAQSAQSAGLVVESVQPVPVTLQAPRGATEPGAPAPAADKARGFIVSVGGGYGGVAQFVRGLPRGPGYGAVRSVRLAPDFVPGSLNVRANIQVEYVALDLAAARTALSTVPAVTAAPSEASR